MKAAPPGDAMAQVMIPNQALPKRIAAPALGRLDYYRRVLLAYGLRTRSPLTFWHEHPEVHPAAFQEGSLAYYMTFREKAAYPGPFDSSGVPVLDYRGCLGRQHNPIAIAQYGLAKANAWLESQRDEDLRVCLRQAEWLLANLRPSGHGIPVWAHAFDWRYREGLRAPWHSALAQGQGISLLVRAARITRDRRYAEGAWRAFAAFLQPVTAGGVTCRDEAGGVWFEEYIVHPPSHILNGFMWAMWGVFDLWRFLGNDQARRLFAEAAATLVSNLHRYDAGYWSCYELRPRGMRMLASPFYHALHITQLEVMARLTGQDVLRAWARGWQAYQQRRWNRTRALAHKALFKLLHY